MSMNSRLFSDGLDPTCIDVTAIGGGGGGNGAPVKPAAGGGTSGFTHRATAWDVLAGKPDCMTDLQEFMGELNESPDLRAAATLRTLSRIRTELERIPETCAMTDPVVMTVQDVALVMRQLMSRLR